MFDNDVTMTYNYQDATIEILIMLAGAFILGALLSWLLSKLQTGKTKNYSSDIVTNTSSQTIDKNIQANMSSKARVISANNEAAAYTTPKFDDLTKVSGINSNIQGVLKEQGINSYTDLRDIKKHDLKQLQNNSIKDTDFNKKLAETWPHQASLAAKGEWKKLDEYQQFIHDSNTEKPLKNTDDSKKYDDLKLIEGIGPRIETILNSHDIDSFKKLSEVDSPTLKKYITDADSRFEKNETESWPHQAAMAEKGQWEELSIYQEFMHSDIGPINVDENKSSLEKTATEIEKTTDDVENDQDDLKKIEGIGPKIEKLLNKSGIYTFSQLSNSNRDRLKSILMAAGNQFKMHEPESWPHQADLAHNGEWEKLKSFQDELNTKSTSLAIDQQNVKRDDLKKIEGIGPKLQELLNGLDIYTYSDLSKADSNEIQKVLDDSGPQYRVHDPKTWPEQAKLAAENKWNDLELLQKEIVHNRSMD